MRDELIGKEAVRRSTTLTPMNGGFFIPASFGIAGVEASLLGVGHQPVGALVVILLVLIAPSLLPTRGAIRKLWKVGGDDARGAQPYWEEEVLLAQSSPL